MIRVIVADDHKLVRQGIRVLLEKTADIAVVGEAANGVEALALVQQLEPEILLLDMAMPQLNGVETIRRFKELKLKTQILALSMYSDETLVQQTLQHGARGYLLKDSVVEELLEAIHTVQRGGIFLCSELPASIRRACLDSAAGKHFPAVTELLTSREREVLQMIAEGDPNKVIASKLELSERTVEKHRAVLMKKLNIHDVAGLIRAAIQHRLIFIDQPPAADKPAGE